jgi:hypothetical protein
MSTSVKICEVWFLLLLLLEMLLAGFYGTGSNSLKMEISDVCTRCQSHSQPRLHMEEEKIKAKQIGPKQFGGEKSIRKIHVPETEDIRKNKKQKEEEL